MKQEQHVDLEKMLGILASGLSMTTLSIPSARRAKHLAIVQLWGFMQA